VTTAAAASGPRKISIDRQPGSRLLTIWGTVPLDDAPHNEALAIEDPADYAASAFQLILQRRGIAVKGKERALHAYLAELPPPVIVAAANELTPVSPGGGTE